MSVEESRVSELSDDQLIAQAYDRYINEGRSTLFGFNIPKGISPSSARVSSVDNPRLPDVIQTTHLHFVDPSGEIVYSLRAITSKTDHSDKGVYLHQVILPDGNTEVIVGPLRVADCF